MKFLKWLLIVLLALAGLLLIIPLFLPSVGITSAETEISISRELVFQNVAQYTDREKWDPWLKMEPEAKVTIAPRPELVGSTYAWEGDKLGTGKMMVDSVVYPSYISSSIWFGDSEDASRIQWNFEDTEAGTKVTWSFTSEGSYPFGRIMMLIMNGMMKSSFESGLADLKRYLEENPPRMYKLSEIKSENSYATHSMVIPVEGNVEFIAEQRSTLYAELAGEINKQELEIRGPAFVHYLDYDSETGYAHALLGFPVRNQGVNSGNIAPKYYDKIQAIATTHYGKYEYLEESYQALTDYVEENDIEVTGEAFEVFLNTMDESENPMDWKTMIAFPIK
ncbi:MAG: SRPBCC family protein [Bacteroidales bacterium]